MKVSIKGHVSVPSRTRHKNGKVSRGERVVAALLQGRKIKGRTQDWLRLTRGTA